MSKKKSDADSTTKRKPKTMPILADFFWMRDDAEKLIIEIIQKKELAERYTYSFMNMEQLDTYSELLWSISYLSVFSYLFRWSEVILWAGPTMLLLGAVVVFATLVFSIYRRGKIQNLARRKKEFSKRLLDANACGFIWLFWCVYSTVIQHLTERASFDSWASYAIGLLAFGVVMVTYTSFLLQGTWKNMSATLVVSLVLLLAPNNDSVNFNLDGFVYFLKLVGFFAIYVTTEFELQLADLIQNGVQMKSLESAITTKNEDPEYTNRYLFQLKRIELIIIRTSWILFCPKFLIFLAAVQLVPLWRQLSFSFNIYRTLHRKVREKDPTLPKALANDDDTQFRLDSKNKEKRHALEESSSKKATLASKPAKKSKHDDVPIIKKPKSKKTALVVSSSSEDSSSSSSDDDNDRKSSKTKQKTKKPIKKSTETKAKIVTFSKDTRRQESSAHYSIPIISQKKKPEPSSVSTIGMTQNQRNLHTKSEDEDTPIKKQNTPILISNNEEYELFVRDQVNDTQSLDSLFVDDVALRTSLENPEKEE
jgi:hypothetical protein